MSTARRVWQEYKPVQKAAAMKSVREKKREGTDDAAARTRAHSHVQPRHFRPRPSEAMPDDRAFARRKLPGLECPHHLGLDHCGGLRLSRARRLREDPLGHQAA